MSGDGDSPREPDPFGSVRFSTIRSHQSPPPSLPAPHMLTPQQVAAIRAVMRLFVEDDRARGVSDHDLLQCDACDQLRPAPGYIRYEQYIFCNACAVAYELARTGGAVRLASEYLRRPRPDPDGIAV